MITFLTISVVILILFSVLFYLIIKKFENNYKHLGKLFEQTDRKIDNYNKGYYENLGSKQKLLESKLTLLTETPTLYTEKPVIGKVYEIKIPESQYDTERNFLISLIKIEESETYYIGGSWKTNSGQFVCKCIDTNEFKIRNFPVSDLKLYCKTELSVLKEQLKKCESKSKLKQAK